MQAVQLAGEVFDVTCFAGVNQYHTLRTTGECSAGSLSSTHIRSVDFEVQCQPENGNPDPTGHFQRMTREMFTECITYTTSIHMAWSNEPNHDRISSGSDCTLQATHDDLSNLAALTPDFNADVVTVILDVVTDRKNCHLVRKIEDAKELTRALAAAKQQLAECESLGHVVDQEAVMERTAENLTRRTKQYVTHAEVARMIEPLADKCAANQKELHLLLVGCNTGGLAAALKSAIKANAQPSVWVVCTSDLWPSDLAPFLWHLYGSYVLKGDLHAYRMHTRNLIGEYTDHYKRQRLVDQSRVDQARDFEQSLANCCHCDRLDRVTVMESGHAKVDLM